MSNLHPIARAGIDIGGLGAVLNAIMAWTTPAITFAGLVLAVLWYGAQLYESKLVQDWIAKWEVKVASKHMKVAAEVIRTLPPEVVDLPAIPRDQAIGDAVAIASEKVAAASAPQALPPDAP